jgi:predicted nucleotidyltransferase
MQALRAAAGLGRSPAQVRLLAYLTGAPGQEFHTRELVRRIDGTERPVHLALESLDKQGYVRSRRVGNLRLWTADTTHPLYSVMRDVLAKAVGVSAQITEILSSERGVQTAFIFGSHAANTDDATSDIDLFVLAAPARSAGVDGTLDALSRRVSRTINPIIWTEHDLANALKNELPILTALKRGPRIWLIGDELEFDGRLGASVRRSGPKERSGSKGRAKQAGSGRKKRSASSARPRRRGS